MSRISVSLNASSADMSAVRQAIEQIDQNFIDLYGDVVDIPQGRLSLAAGTPVRTSNVSSAINIYYTPYIGQMVPIYNGTTFDMVDIGGDLVNVTTDATTNPAAAAITSVYDMFIWLNNGVPTLSRGPAWTSNAVRSAGTALARIRGLMTNAVAITNGPAQYMGTYVGTIATNSATATVSWIFGGVAAGGTKAVLGVWNMYNRVTIQTRVTDSAVPYTYTTAVVRYANGSANNAIMYVIGMAEEPPTFYYQQTVTTAAAAGATVQVSIGDDSSTVMELGGTFFQAQAAFAATGTLDAVYTKGQGETIIGLHTASAIELGDGLNANTFNVGSLGELSGIIRM